MDVRLKETPIHGCYEIFFDSFSDLRGKFVKTYIQDLFIKRNLRTDWCEEYYSVSKRSVIRGMHFQVPPDDHAKLVHCIAGRAHDVILDIRIGSPTYGYSHSLMLDSETANCIYIPSGLAHGFMALTDECVMHYKVTSAHAAHSDRGILWSSFCHQWPEGEVIVSDRDGRHPPLVDFNSPFIFGN
ncbi:MAG: dTDP-4-dehydrorhamnose 3,5-epimerase family protein [Pseudomonadota bacterium]